jgi:hypothetical protein
VVNLSGSTLISACGGGVSLSENVTLSSTNTSMSSFLTVDAVIVTVNGGAMTASNGGLGLRLNGTGRSAFHGVRFDQQMQLYGAASYDFGSGGGNNTFNAGLTVQIDHVNVNASGNRWIPNQQGADANGIMPTTPIVGPVDGPNVSVAETSVVTM